MGPHWSEKLFKCSIPSSSLHVPVSRCQHPVSHLSCSGCHWSSYSVTVGLKSLPTQDADQNPCLGKTRAQHPPLSAGWVHCPCHTHQEQPLLSSPPPPLTRPLWPPDSFSEKQWTVLLPREEMWLLDIAWFCWLFPPTLFIFFLGGALESCFLFCAVLSHWQEESRVRTLELLKEGLRNAHLSSWVPRAYLSCHWADLEQLFAHQQTCNSYLHTNTCAWLLRGC